MRYVDRDASPMPPSLATTGVTELDRARAHYAQHDAQDRPATFSFAAYKGNDVKEALLALFHGKCAYCEANYASTAPVDVEHFRPKGAVSECPSHSGYWWLAMAWDNLLPSCIDCNRRRKQQLLAQSDSLEALMSSATQSGKKDSFPLRVEQHRLMAMSYDYDAEQALLLNPCVDQPESCLAFVTHGNPPVSLVVPVGDEVQRMRGAVSIQTYGLNRLGLVQDRTRLLRRLEFLGSLIVEIDSVIGEVQRKELGTRIGDDVVATVVECLEGVLSRAFSELAQASDKTSPYSAMARAWLANFLGTSAATPRMQSVQAAAPAIWPAGPGLVMQVASSPASSAHGTMPPAHVKDGGVASERTADRRR